MRKKEESRIQNSEFRRKKRKEHRTFNIQHSTSNKIATRSVPQKPSTSKTRWLPPVAIDPPRSPLNLTIEFYGENALALRWEKPPFDTRRPVRIFIVQRRPADYSLPWQLAGISFGNRYELTPGEIKDNSRSLYRIIATNDNGSSLPGNVVSLPA